MKKLRPGWSFNDGTQIHIGNVPGVKRPVVYVQEGVLCKILGFLKDDECADILAKFHEKLASGEKA